MPGYYIDSSVLLHAILGSNQAALNWFGQVSRAAPLVSSKLLSLETIRVLRRDGQDLTLADPFLDRIALVSLDDRTIQVAANFTEHVKTLDALHLATLMLVDPELILATHDVTMARVGKGLGLRVIDPLS